MITTELYQHTEQLLGQAGFSGPFTLNRLEGGANNRVYRVDATGDIFLLKAYFRHPADPRDRLEAEFAFCRFAWEHTIQTVPRPVAINPSAGLALYQFIAGSRLTPQQVEETHVWQAIDFYRNLNHYRHTPAARALPIASEAYFSLADHLQGVDRRVQRLSTIHPFQAEEAAACDLVQVDLQPLWRQVYAETLANACLLGIDPDDRLPDADRRLSPSDFGFHNALLTPNNQLRFIDFEYAGWDDPAKLVCDFFCQPAVPVPAQYFETVACAVAADLTAPELHLQRFTLLLPVYRIKWICMLLNDFLPVDNARRKFSQHSESSLLRKTRQLQKAQIALEQFSFHPLIGV